MIDWNQWARLAWGVDASNARSGASALKVLASAARPTWSQATLSARSAVEVEASSASPKRWLRDVTRRIQLVPRSAMGVLCERAESAFERGDVEELYAVYRCLPIGGLWTRRPLARRMMASFLTGAGDQSIPWEVLAEGSLLHRLAQTEREILFASVRTALRENRFGTPMVWTHADLARGEDDVHYATGDFMVMSRTVATVNQEADGKLRVVLEKNHEVVDPYDWHRDEDAQMPKSGRFRDEWAQALVESGKAKVFNVRSHGQDRQEFLVNRGVDELTAGALATWDRLTPAPRNHLSFFLAKLGIPNELIWGTAKEDTHAALCAQEPSFLRQVNDRWQEAGRPLPFVVALPAWIPLEPNRHLRGLSSRAISRGEVRAATGSGAVELVLRTQFTLEQHSTARCEDNPPELLGYCEAEHVKTFPMPTREP